MTDPGDLVHAVARQLAVAAEAVTVWPAGLLGWEPVDVTIDEHGSTVTVGQWGGYWLQIAVMAFNDRILMAEQKHPTGWFDGDGGWDHGWCYPRGGAAVHALMVWQPQHQAEPPGYERRAAPGPARQPGQPARWFQREAAGG